MQKINVYFGHSKELDYQTYYEELLKTEELSDCNLILPHLKDKNSLNGVELYTKDNMDIFIAETSLKATGLGIELGLSYTNGIPIICLYKKGTKTSNSLKSISNRFYEYENLEDFIRIVVDIVIEIKIQKTKTNDIERVQKRVRKK